MLHVHGGGFVSQSSELHEIYLKPWCKELKIPIVSIDYSLAPEYPYPRAPQECFYVYAWCLLNKSLLGWTGEKIICVGDSAGGTLVTNIVQQAITHKIRIPDALVPIYTPFLLNYNLSPSRLLAIMDPMLNIGMLFQFGSAYCGNHFEIEKEMLKFEVNLNSQKAFDTRKKYSIISFNKNVSKSSQPELLSYEALEEESNEAKYLDEQNQTNNNRLKKLHKLMGDSAFLFESISKSPVINEPLFSPLLSDDEMLAYFPPTWFIVR